MLISGMGELHLEVITHRLERDMNIPVRVGRPRVSYRETISAVADAKKQSVSTLIDIKVMPKTMTDGYESWWRCGVAEVSQKKEIQAAYAGQQEGIKNARPY